MKKEEIEKQREIGKQLFLVNILHYENDRARKGGYSFLSRDKLAAWASMTKEELDRFMKISLNGMLTISIRAFNLPFYTTHYYVRTIIFWDIASLNKYNIFP